MGDFDQILNSWLGQFSKGQVPMKAEARISALTELFERFKQENFPKSYFTSMVKGRIITKCINPNHPDKKKRRKWAEYVDFHLNIAFHSVFTEAVAQEENPLASPVINDVAEVDIESMVEEHNEEIVKVKKTKKEVFADTPKEDGGPGNNDSDYNFDPEMAKLLGIKL